MNHESFNGIKAEAGGDLAINTYAFCCFFLIMVIVIFGMGIMPNILKLAGLRMHEEWEKKSLLSLSIDLHHFGLGWIKEFHPLLHFKVWYNKWESRRSLVNFFHCTIRAHVLH